MIQVAKSSSETPGGQRGDITQLSLNQHLQNNSGGDGALSQTDAPQKVHWLPLLAKSNHFDKTLVQREREHPLKFLLTGQDVLCLSLSLGLFTPLRFSFQA